MTTEGVMKIRRSNHFGTTNRRRPWSGIILFSLLLVFHLSCGSNHVLAALKEGAEVSDWHGYRKQSSTLEGHPCFVVEPAIAAPGKPWVWRTSFPDFHPEVDLELLRLGCHVAFVDCVDMLGCDAALDLMDRFYDGVRRQWGLSARPALEAVSRGGLHAYRYAARRPGRIACIYADTPVMDLKSWPKKWPESRKQWGEAMKLYGFANEQDALAFKGNPIDLLENIARAGIPLRHVISLNDTVVPPEENTLEARRRLQALGHGMEIVTVKEGTTESHGHHFTLPEVFTSARFVMRNAYVLPKNAEYFTLRDGLANARAKFEHDRTGRVAFLGGSITFNPGWRDEVMRYLQQRFPETKFDFVAAGIPSLGSVPDAFRLERDVLSRGAVDLLVVEAAVNDTTNEKSTGRMLRGMEGVVRHVRVANPMTDIVQMHFVMPEHMADYRRGTLPASIEQHDRVAVHYGCPSLNLSLEVTDRIEANEFSWAGDFRDVHPSPYGQRVYAGSMLRLLDYALAAPAPAGQSHAVPDKPLDPHSYFRGRLGALQELKVVKGFTLVPSWKPDDGKATREGFVNVPALVATEPGSEIEIVFQGTGAGLFIAAGPDAGVLEFRTDGGGWKTVDTFTPWSSGLHLPWAVILDDELQPGRHITQVRLSGQHNPKSQGTAARIVHLLLN
jgi:sialidase-1